MWVFALALVGAFVLSFVPGVPSGTAPTSLKDFEQAVIDCQAQNGVKELFTGRVNFRPNRVTVTCNNNVEIVRNAVQ